MKIKGLTAALCGAALLLGGCGSGAMKQDNPFVLALKTMRDNAKSKRNSTAAQPGLTRAMIDQVDSPLVLASLESRGVTGALVPIGVNGADVTWSTADLISVSMRGTVVRGTRGLGEDLMSAVIPSESELNRNGHITHRVYYTVDGDDQTKRAKYSCEVVAEGSESVEIVQLRYVSQRYSEVCKGAQGGFTNQYWFVGGSKIIQSRQWISPSVGFMKLQTLK